MAGAVVGETSDRGEKGRHAATPVCLSGLQRSCDLIRWKRKGLTMPCKLVALLGDTGPKTLRNIHLHRIVEGPYHSGGVNMAKLRQGLVALPLAGCMSSRLDLESDRHSAEGGHHKFCWTGKARTKTASLRSSSFRRPCQAVVSPVAAETLTGPSTRSHSGCRYRTDHQSQNWWAW